MTTWTKVGRNEDFPAGLHQVRAGDQKVIVAVLESEIFAFHPFCPHAAGPLHLSEVEGTIIACPLHGWRFDLRTGGNEIHGFRALRMYDLRIDHGEVFIDLQSRTSEAGTGQQPIACQ